MNNKAIAQQILTDYHNGDYGVMVEGWLEFTIDGLKIRCKDRFTAVYAVSEKFRKWTNSKVTQPVPNKPRPVTRRFSIKAFNQFLQDCEPDNAVHYAQLFEWKLMSPEIQASVRHAAGIRSE